VTAKVSFAWSPFEAARSFTCEEDLLTELHGRKDRPKRTEPRFLRVDFVLSATLPDGSRAPMPDTEIWSPWVAWADEKLGRMLPRETLDRRGRFGAVVSWRGGAEVEGAPLLRGGFPCKVSRCPRSR
jgi:hypothetical protein